MLLIHRLIFFYMHSYLAGMIQLLVFALCWLVFELTDPPLLLEITVMFGLVAAMLTNNFIQKRMPRLCGWMTKRMIELSVSREREKEHEALEEGGVSTLMSRAGRNLGDNNRVLIMRIAVTLMLATTIGLNDVYKYILLSLSILILSILLYFECRRTEQVLIFSGNRGEHFLKSKSIWLPLDLITIELRESTICFSDTETETEIRMPFGVLLFPGGFVRRLVAKGAVELPVIVE